MARTKAKVRRINAPSFVAAPGQRIGNKNILNRRNAKFKIKTIEEEGSSFTLAVTGGLDFERHDIYSAVDLFKQHTYFRKAVNSRNWVCVDRPNQLPRDFFDHLFLILNVDDIRVREGIIFFVPPGLI